MTPPTIAVTDLHLRRGTRQVLAGMDFEVMQGEVVALMGASGSGKSTILRAIAGLEPFESGAIELDGVTVPSGPPQPRALRELRRKVGMVFQFHCLFEHLTALQNVTLAPMHVQRLARPEAERRAHELLASLGVEHRAKALPRELSGGEAQRVAIARALANRPLLLLADEPTGNLDPSTAARVHDELLRLIAEEGLGALVATHNLELARGMSRIARIEQGRIFED